MQSHKKQKARAIDLSEFDLTTIEALDPCRAQGDQKEIFREDLAFRIHFINEDGSRHTLEKQEIVTTKMFCCLSEEGHEYFRVELSSDSDIFFFYAHL